MTFKIVSLKEIMQFRAASNIPSYAIDAAWKENPGFQCRIVFPMQRTIAFLPTTLVSATITFSSD